MTEKLYYKNAYIKEFDAVVLSCTEKLGIYDIILDKTAFFPEGGGQTSDRGFIECSEIFDVQESDGVVHHFSKHSVNVNKSVRCVINFDERFEKMQCHTAEHILSGLFHSLYGIENTGFHLGSEIVTFDTSEEVDCEMIAKVESLANDAIYKNAAVTVKFPKSEELDNLEYRSKLDITESVRIVDIEGYDSCACCAPHVSFTGEIGYIKIIGFEKHRGGSRITMLAGKRAYLYMDKVAKEASSVSALLSSPVTEISDECEKFLRSKADLEYKFSATLRECAKMLAENIQPTEFNAVFYYRFFDMDALRCFANEASSRIGGTLVALSGEEGSYKYILMNKGDDFKNTVMEANANLCGKGGGRAPQATGTYSASLEEIKKYFEK